MNNSFINLTSNIQSNNSININGYNINSSPQLYNLNIGYDNMNLQNISSSFNENSLYNINNILIIIYNILLFSLLFFSLLHW